MTRSRWIRPGLALLLVALLATLATQWFRKHFESYEITHRTGEKPAARANPLLAAERFLRAIDVTVAPAPDLLSRRYHLPERGLLILDTGRDVLGTHGQQRLLEWVRAGGQLAIEAPASLPRSLADPILQALEVEAESINGIDDDKMRRLTHEAFGLAIDFDPDRVMHTERKDMEEQFGDDNGYHVLRFGVGAGAITLFSDLHWLRNDSIGRYDHARLLYRFVRNAEASTVLLLHRIRAPSLAQRLLRAIPLTLATLALAVGLLLARVTRRFGPLLPAGRGDRRQLLEHIEASGYYLWAEGFSSTLLEAARARVRRKLYQLWPELEKTPPAEQITRLAEITRLPGESIESALFTRARTQRESFTRQIRQLEKLRKRL